MTDDRDLEARLRRHLAAEADALPFLDDTEAVHRRLAERPRRWLPLALVPDSDVSELPLELGEVAPALPLVSAPLMPGLPLVSEPVVPAVPLLAALRDFVSRFFPDLRFAFFLVFEVCDCAEVPDESCWACC